MNKFNKKTAVLLLFSLAFAGNLSGALQTVADWDFTNPNILKNKYALKLQGKSTANKTGLLIPGGNQKEKAGAVTVKNYPDLSPNDNFTATVNFILSSKNTWKQSFHILLDSKYIPAPNAKQTANHCGFMLYLRHKDKNIFIPTAAFGYKTKSFTVTGNPVTVAFDKPQKLQMVYDGKGNVNFVFNGKAAGAGKVQPGRFTPATLALHFGARAGADHWPLGGSLLRVTLQRNIPKKPTVPAPQKPLPPGAVAASWNLTTPAVLKGKYPLRLRGTSKITANGLTVMNANPKTPGGAAVIKNNPIFTPPKAFEVNADIILDAKFKRFKNREMLFDSKYIPNPTEEQAKYHKGFMFYLTVLPKNKFSLGAAFGFGTHSAHVESTPVAIPYGKAVSVSMKFTADGKVIFSLNRKAFCTRNIPKGSVVHSDLAPVLGDRYAKLYYPLGGSLKKIEIKIAK